MHQTVTGIQTQVNTIQVEHTQLQTTVQQIQQSQTSLEERILRLEQREPAAPTGDANPTNSQEPTPNRLLPRHLRTVVVVGTWPEETPKETLLDDLRPKLQSANVQYSAVWVPSRRWHLAKLRFPTPEATQQFLRNPPTLYHSHAPHRKLWFSLERNQEEQERARPFGTAIRTLKELLEASAHIPPDDYDLLDFDYVRGVAWWGRSAGAPRLLARAPDGLITPLPQGFHQAGLDLQWYLQRHEANTLRQQQLLNLRVQL